MKRSKVAAAGFHFVGKDLLQCTVCFKKVQGWEKDESWEEQSRRAQFSDITVMELADLVIRCVQRQTVLNATTWP